MRPWEAWRRMMRRAVILAAPSLLLVLLLPISSCALTRSRPAATSTPTPDPLSALSVYVPTQWNVCVLRASDGKQRVCYNQQGGLAFAVVDGIMYGAFGSTAYALRSSDGASLWHQTFPDGEFVVGGAISSDTWYIATRDPGQDVTQGSLYALRVSDGASLWRDRIDVVAYGPFVLDGVLYAAQFTSAGGDNLSADIIAVRAGDGAMLWQYPLGVNTGDLLAVGEGALYLCELDGVVRALRLSDRTMIWHASVPDCRTLQAIGDAVFAGGSANQGQTNTLYALRASDGVPLWLFQPVLPTAPVTVAQGVVYLATTGQSSTHSGDNRLYALRAADGSLLWQAPIASSGNLPANMGVQPPIVVADRVFVGTTSAPLLNHPHLADVYAYDAHDGQVLWRTPITRGIETFLGPIWVG